MAFGYYRTLTVDHTQVPSTQTNFTVLVSVTNATLKVTGSGGHVTSSSGYDIGFYSDLVGTKLKWEMESYDGTNGIVVAWVKIASLSSSSDSVFYMFYGDASITTDQSDKANTWDTNFIAVWHMDDNAASTTIVESTTRGVNAVNSANTSTKTTTGQVSSALAYNGSSDASQAALNLSSTTVVMLSAWVNWTTNANDDHLVFEYTSNFNSNSGFLVDWNDSGGAFVFGTHSQTPTPLYWTDSFTRPSAGSFHLIHLLMDKSVTTGNPFNKGYVDGSSQTLSTKSHQGGSNNNFDNSSLYFMSRAASSLRAAGTLDEVHLSIVERSANWITCEWNNQKTSSTFVSLGSEITLVRPDFFIFL